MTLLLITNGRVIDPSQGLDRVTNLLIENGRIAAYDADPSRAGFQPASEDTTAGKMPTPQVIDAAGKIVVPGLVDLSTQLREPGFEEDETIETGTRAALAGGFTTIACL